MCSGYHFSSELKSHYVFFILPLAINLITHSPRSFFWCLVRSAATLNDNLFSNVAAKLHFHVRELSSVCKEHMDTPVTETLAVPSLLTVFMDQCSLL